MEISLKRPALDRAIPICGESTGEDSHITKATLKRLLQNTRHLVFEVLCRDKWVEKSPALIDHGVNFTAATAEVRVIIESLPKVIDGLVSRFRTSINKDTCFRLESHHV